MSAENYVQEQLSKLALELRPFEIEKASDQEWQALNRLTNQQRGEEYPDDPPTLLQDTIRGLKSIPDFVVFHSWIVWRGDEAVSRFTYEYTTTEDNQHLLNFGIYVMPELRRQGIGTLLLHLIVEAAESLDRRLLMTGTDSMIPAGEAFMECLDAKMAMAMDENQLVVAEVDASLMQKWVAQAPERAGDLELELWIGPYPEEKLEQIAEMKQVMNTAPTDDMDVEDWQITPDQLRAIDETFRLRGIERWTMAVHDPVNDTYAGYTQLMLKDTQPYKMEQGDTGVLPAYRERGIGRWIKGAMMLKVLQERPEVKFIRTGNASSNKAMLKINHEMGFQRYKVWQIWQIETDALKDHLVAE